MPSDIPVEPDFSAEPDLTHDLPEPRRPSLAVGVLGYLLLLAVILGGLALGVMAILQPMVLPAVRLLLQHH